MQAKLLDVLACPVCGEGFVCEGEESPVVDDVDTGRLRCEGCARTYPIRNGIPRFVSDDNYAASFGVQWNLFKGEQIDTVNGFKLSATRFYAETGWPPESLSGKWLLDAGCGAGRFLDVASSAGAEVVGIDISNAVDAAGQTLRGRKNVHLVQASIYALPFRPGVFDGCYCLGVIQHTPDPLAALRALPRVVRPGGRLGVFIYERKRWTRLYAKYLVRPLTTRLSNAALLQLIKTVMPLLFPLSEVTFRIPVFGRLFAFMIPVSNYVGANTRTNGGLSIGQRYRWAVMDTFDMLAPRYDQPLTQAEAEAALREAGVGDIHRTAPYGLCLDGRRQM
jgi:SAM-dependent methyltransferase